VVVLVSLATGIGAGGGLLGLVAGVIASLLGWYVWSALTYWIGTRIFPEPTTQSNLGELLRTIGFAKRRDSPRSASFRFHDPGLATASGCWWPW
jgi:hypothetical protein